VANRHLITKDLIQQLSEVAVEAGDSIMEIYGGPDPWDVDVKSDSSPLTQADLHSNQIILNALSRITPDIPALSEESPWLGGNVSTYWAVDPLDGTKEFINRNGEFTVNIGLVVDGCAQAGVIYAPAIGEIWAGVCGDDDRKPWAAKATRALDWESIAVTQLGLDEGVTLRSVGSRSHGGGETPSWLRDHLSRATNISRGSSLKFCLVAEGNADVYLRMGPTSIWDTAAGHAIVSAAGGAVLDVNTREELRYLDPRRTLNPSFLVVGDVAVIERRS
jgi:3'(2'), 5'-bisphosphate nucleotidase